MKDILTYVIESKTLTKLTLSKCQDKTVLRTTGRLITMKGQLFLALESFLSDGKAVQKNIPAADAAAVLSGMLPDQYKQLNITATGGDCEVKVSKKGTLCIA